MTITELVWVGVGFAGQVMFSLRLLLQWMASERAGRSIMPVAFWYFSIVGGLMLLSYAIWRRDPVFILGQSTGVVIYARNLVLIRRESARIVDEQSEYERDYVLEHTQKVGSS